ncbi:hypothetical protein, partial [Roseovarius sp. SYSU LYC5161]|uniref:hypothetical protein n=1 Tax=Roseovarius halophilus (ex Wu et al. 2025) TaxID=3376060 RepID=UPI00399AE86E
RDAYAMEAADPAVFRFGLPVALAPLITARLPVPAVSAPYALPMAEAALYSLLAVLIFTFWPLSRTQEIRAATLFRDGSAPARALP